MLCTPNIPEIAKDTDDDKAVSGRASEMVRFAFGFALPHPVIAYKLAHPQTTFGVDTNSLLTGSCNIASVGLCNDSKEVLGKKFKE